MREAVNKIPTGRLISFNINNAARRKFDDCFLIDGDIVLESLGNKDYKAQITLLPDIHGVPNAIAIEPMSKALGAYHNDMGLIITRPNEGRTFKFTIEILRLLNEKN